MHPIPAPTASQLCSAGIPRGCLITESPKLLAPHLVEVGEYLECYGLITKEKDVEKHLRVNPWMPTIRVEHSWKDKRENKVKMSLYS